MCLQNALNIYTVTAKDAKDNTLVMAEPIVATWSVAFARLGASTFTVKEKLALHY
jgi:hypothetical protein